MRICRGRGYGVGFMCIHKNLLQPLLPLNDQILQVVVVVVVGCRVSAVVGGIFKATARF